MTTPAPQHLRQRPRRSPVVRPTLTVRRGTVVATGAALAVPASFGAVIAAAPAKAATPAIQPQAAPTPAAAPATPTSPTSVVVLRYSSKGTLVKVLQSRLGITVDGSFGPQTLGAVKSFQDKHSLEADGLVGPLTWSALGGYPGSIDEPPETPNPACTSYVIRYGSSGEVVTAAQKRLGITQDGRFGPGTLAAVKTFQASNDLAQDGIVGPMTWSALGGYPCDSDAPTPPPASEPPPPGDGDGPTTDGERVLNIAKKYIGIQYVYGGEDPSGFDCSGLTQYVYRQLGVSLPRTSLQQSKFAPAIDLDNLRVGDIVFFYSPVHHVAIYAGNGMILDAAQPGTRISIHKMWVKPVKASRLV